MAQFTANMLFTALQLVPLTQRRIFDRFLGIDKVLRNTSLQDRHEGYAKTRDDRHECPAEDKAQVEAGRVTELKKS